MAPIRSAVMRGIQVSRFGGPDVLQLKHDLRIPTVEGTQVLIQTKAIGVNPVDTYIRSGEYTTLPSLPFIPGLEASGVIAATGSNSSKFKEGDRVCCARTVAGSYAEFVLAEEKYVFALHENVEFSAGAAIGVAYCTAVRALMLRCHARIGETVLVHGGSGAVGLATCQLARASGLQVYATAGTSVGMRLAQENGAHHVFNHTKPGYQDQIMNATDHQGVDIVIEMLANVNLQSDLKMTKEHGRIASSDKIGVGISPKWYLSDIVGNRGSIEINPRLAMINEISIHGVVLGKSSTDEWRQTSDLLWWGQQQGWLKPVVGCTYPLQDVVQAHIEVIEHKGGTKGKIVLTV